MKLQLKEISRRGIFKTLAAYALVSWVVIEVVSVIAPAFLLPDWIVAVVTTILVLGTFPLLVFSWRYEVTQTGIKKDTAEVSDEVGVAARRISVLVFFVLLAATTALWLNYFRSQSASEVEAMLDAQDGAPVMGEDGRIESIAVLPFHDLSPEGGRQLLADGIAETILHVLAQNKELLVISRTSSFYFRDKPATASEIGRILDVQALLEGSIQVTGDRLRVTTQLIRTTDQAHLWSEVYEATLESVFHIQDSIAQTVEGLILREETALKIQGADYPSLEAYELLLEAQSHLDIRTFDSIEQAIRNLRLVIEMEPSYSDAYAWLARALRIHSSHPESDTSPGEYIYEHRELVDKALELKPANAMAIMQKGMLSQDQGSSGYAEAREKALELAPNDPEVLRWVAGQKLQDLDLRSAEELVKRGTRVSPADHAMFRWHIMFACHKQRVSQLVETHLENYPPASSLVALGLRSQAAYCDGEYAEGFRKLIQILRLNPDANSAVEILRLLADLGSAEARGLSIQAVPALPRWFLSYSYLTSAYPKIDMREEYERALRTALNNGNLNVYFGCHHYARIQMERGDLEGASYSLNFGQEHWEHYWADTHRAKVQEQTLQIYGYQSWLLMQQGRHWEAKQAADILFRFMEKRGLQEWDSMLSGSLGDVLLLVMLLSDQHEQAVTWIRDAAENDWFGFDALETSPLFAEFRKDPQVIGLIARLKARRQVVLRQIEESGIPEASNPQLLMDVIDQKVPERSILTQAKVATALRNFQLAAELHKKAIKSSPTNSSTLYATTWWAASHGQIEIAESLARYRVNLEPENSSSHYTLGRMYFIAGKWQKAIEEFRTSNSIDADAGSRKFWESMALVMNAQPEKALTEISNEPNEFRREVGLAIVHASLGELEKAEATLEEASASIARMGHSPWLGEQLYLVRALANLNHTDEAFEVLKTRLAGCAQEVDIPILSDPLLANLHDDPRWLPFLESIGQHPDQLKSIEFNPQLSE